MFAKIKYDHRNIKNEEKFLNVYLLVGWGLVLIVLLGAYLFEVIKHAFSIYYYLNFLAITIIPYIFCVAASTKDSFQASLRIFISLSYLGMYVFVLFTGHTHLVFTYILPLSTLLILYHDAKLIIELCGLTTAVNIIYIIREYHNHIVTLENSRDYEIQIALIILCFAASIISAKVYDKITRLKNENDSMIQKLNLEKIALEEEKKWASLDYLTRLFNRKKFDEVLNDITTINFKPFFFVSIDINGLKKCNDNLGHLAGDKLIIGMACCMQKAFDKNCNIFRLGGDEFSIISTESKAEFDSQLDMLKDCIKNWNSDIDFKLSASIGVLYVGEIENKERLIQLVDEKMYEEKKLYYKSL